MPSSRAGTPSHLSGVDDGTRTHDDQIHNLGLYQLSYAHHCCCWDSRYRQRFKLVPMARLAGLEPATTGLEGRCSIRLSYRRIAWLHQLRAGSQRFGRGKRI